MDTLEKKTKVKELWQLCLPCPNIFAGGLNFHGRYEFVPIQNMEKAMNVIVKIAELVASK